MEPYIKERLTKIRNERLFSFSRLSLVDTCLLQFYLKYVLELKEIDSLPLYFGKAVHKAIEQYALGDDDKTALLKGLEEIGYLPINFNEYIKLYNNVKRHLKSGSANKASVELEHHFVIDIGEGIKLQGYIDYLENVEGVYRFKDWKTNRKPYDALDTYQLALYALAISLLKNTQYVMGELVFLRFYKDNSKKHLFRQSDKEQARQWAVKNAKKALNAVDEALNGKPIQEAFPKCLSSKCSFCPFADLCISIDEKGMEKL